MGTMPAINNEPVTTAHVMTCLLHGHAIHTVDGVDTGICPRCGEPNKENQTKGQTMSKQPVTCNCEACPAHTCYEDDFSLQARALFVGTVCDGCAVACMREYVTAMRGWELTDSNECVTTISNPDTGEIVAKFYGKNRNHIARNLLLRCRRWSF